MSGRSRAPRPHPDPGPSGRSIPAAGCCAGLAVTGLAYLDQLRALEAAAGATLVGVVLGRSTHIAGSPLVVYPVDGGRSRALEITWQSSSVVAALPVLAVAAMASLLPSARPRTTAAVAALTTLVIVLANQARLVLIAVATARFGRDGFDLSHRLVGSGLVLLSLVGGLGLLLRAHGRSTTGSGRGR